MTDYVSKRAIDQNEIRLFSLYELKIENILLYYKIVDAISSHTSN